MPPKRRNDKRRYDGPPASAFDSIFSSGFDFFRELEPFGLTDNPQDLESREAIRVAWEQHGASFMATWEPQPNQPSPWAMGAFGQPNGLRER